ncbi:MULTISPECIES: hypothetical protein [Hymenobacter]|uniref:XRE family transcriptional regulator n=1 Tax=Hymenobacter citatus TaxID=2763506 RepID=A0ABR7MMW5_9BACT|nr:MULTISPECIES: hypothetical protein [Hymenobacter]MBC6612429.1 hypothetical protein [Hymenobacter citatus]
MMPPSRRTSPQPKVTVNQAEPVPPEQALATPLYYTPTATQIHTLSELLDATKLTVRELTAAWKLDYRSIQKRRKHPELVTVVQVYRLALIVNLAPDVLFELIRRELVAKGELPETKLADSDHA